MVDNSFSSGPVEKGCRQQIKRICEKYFAYETSRTKYLSALPVQGGDLMIRIMHVVGGLAHSVEQDECPKKGYLDHIQEFSIKML